uniref:Uncharacterized protein n=1 Tax=Podarcis muralis TaxID=64176 RepID=A0A670KBC9_PODMU
QSRSRVDLTVLCEHAAFCGVRFDCLKGREHKMLAQEADLFQVAPFSSVLSTLTGSSSPEFQAGDIPSPA